MIPQASRDLLWTINSPSLIRASDGRVPEWPPCLESDFESAVLQQRLDATPRYRVGSYFEDLFHFYLQSIRGFEIVARGLQIQENGRTLGEIDFLFRDDGGSLIHCETAVKFYLYLPNTKETGSHFIGPNAADNFERKMTRLFEHQLPMSENRFPGVNQRIAFVKGRIFYHPFDAEAAALPGRLSPEHLRGSWIRESELDLLDQLGAAAQTVGFRIARKPHWLAPDSVTDASAFDHKSIDHESELQTADGLKSLLRQHFTERRTPQLVNRLTIGGHSSHDFSHVFVVSDQWPHDAG
ncbi:MAG: DUF1853 family protein [Rhodopirellula sp.]|nr:DUF1853 family protein [Rhodopirellula sp.]